MLHGKLVQNVIGLIRVYWWLKLLESLGDYSSCDDVIYDF